MSLAFVVVGCVQGANHTGTGGSSGGGTGGSGSAASTGGGSGGSNGSAGSDGSGGTTGGSGGATTSSGGRTGTAGSGAGGMTTTGSGGAPGTGGHVPSGDAGTRPDLTGRTALFIVDDPNSLDDGDVLIEELLQIRGMTVTFGSIATPPAMASSFNMLIISSGVGSDAVSVFAPVPVPVIVFGNTSFYQPMGFVTANAVDAAAPAARPSNGVMDTTTALSSDLAMGQMFVVINTAIANTQYTWGIPGGAPIKVATIVGMPTEMVVFAYEKGAAMATGTAAARRVSLGWKSNAVKALTLDAFKLQDGAFSWTAGAP